MKAKIIILDPCGVEVEEVEFEIPLVEFIEGRYEPKRKNRFVLDINGYKYLVRKDGELDYIGKELGDNLQQALKK